MNDTNISNNTGGLSSIISADTLCESAPAINSDLIGFTFSDEEPFEIRVVALCGVNPDRYVIVERLSGHDVGKHWRVPAGLIRIIKGPERKKGLRLAS